MLRFVVGAAAANMMLVQYNSDVPISLACSIGVSNRPDHDIIGNTSMGGPRWRVVRRASVGGRVAQNHIQRPPIGTEVGIPDPQAIEDDTDARASTTIARLDPRLRATFAAHVLSQVERRQ